MNTKTVSAAQPAWFVQAEALKAQALDRLETMPLRERTASSDPQQWSAAQIVSHLLRVEELLVNEWYPAAQNAPSARPGPQGAWIVGMVNMLLKTPLRIPTVPGLEPTGSLELADLSQCWGAVRKRLPATMPAQPAALWIIHPIFGPLSSQQMGGFLVAHLRHHLRQLKGKP